MFGLISDEVTPLRPGTNPAADRSKIRKGNSLATRKTVKEMIQQERSLVLPDITTTQLVQQTCDVTNARAFVENPLSRTERRLLLRRGKLRESWTTETDESVEKLDGLIGCKLSIDAGQETRSVPERDQKKWKEERKQRSSLSKTATDSGFYDDSQGSVASGDSHSPKSSENHTCCSRSSLASDECATALNIQRLSGEKFKPELSPVLNETRPIIRRDERLELKAQMCTQSQQSLRADLMTLKTAASEECYSESIESSNNDIGAGKSSLLLLKDRPRLLFRRCSGNSDVLNHKMQVKVERTLQNCSRQESGISMALLKNRRKLLSRRSSDNSGLCANVGRRLQAANTRDHYSHAEVGRVIEPNTGRARRLSGQYREKTDNMEKEVIDESCEISSITLTKESLSEVAGEHEFVDVNAKCQEWLSRWLAVNNTTEDKEV